MQTPVAKRSLDEPASGEPTHKAARLTTTSAPAATKLAFLTQVEAILAASVEDPEVSAFPDEAKLLLSKIHTRLYAIDRRVRRAAQRNEEASKLARALRDERRPAAVDTLQCTLTGDSIVHVLSFLDPTAMAKAMQACYSFSLAGRLAVHERLKCLGLELDRFGAEAKKPPLQQLHKLEQQLERVPDMIVGDIVDQDSLGQYPVCVLSKHRDLFVSVFQQGFEMDEAIDRRYRRTTALVLICKTVRAAAKRQGASAARDWLEKNAGIVVACLDTAGDMGIFLPYALMLMLHLGPATIEAHMDAVVRVLTDPRYHDVPDSHVAALRVLAKLPTHVLAPVVHEHVQPLCSSRSEAVREAAEELIATVNVES